MPYYEFSHPVTNHIIGIYQSMDDVHEYVDEEGVKWNRVFHNPQAVIGSLSNLDPKDPQAFVKATGQKKGKLKDIYQLSAELSEKRAQKEGVDQVKLKNWERYEQARGKNTIHPERAKTEIKEKFKSKLDIEI